MSIDTEPLTLSAYARLQDPEHDSVTELVRGRVVREPRPSHLHGAVQAALAYHLSAWTRGQGVGRVYTESGFALATDPPTVRGPDVALVLGEPVTTATAAGPGGWLSGAPDLAVEVLSPTDTSSRMQAKVLDYLEAGAQRVWVVDPETRTVTSYRPSGEAVVFREQDRLEEAAVLPGFGLALRELFG